MTEQRICQNCKSEFVIEEEDFSFYQKINVPPPTFCPMCRMQRRLQFRNHKTVYLRTTLDGDQKMISAFAPDSPLKIYSQKYWYSDECSPAAGREYDFSRPFFDQFRELMQVSPWPTGYNVSAVNSEYCNNCIDLKNCYLAFNSGYLEDCAYVVDTRQSKNCLDTLNVDRSELCYELFDCEKCYRAFYSTHCRECTDIYFCENLTDCHNCFGSVNLKNKSFHIFNQPYNKEEYYARLVEFDLGSRSGIDRLGKVFESHRLGYPFRYYHGFHNVNVTGDYVNHSKDCRNVFYSADLENCAYCQLVLFSPGRDSFDLSIAAGSGNCYELGEAGGYNSKFTWYAGSKDLKLGMMEVEYSMNCFECSYLFGCVGLKNKKYCILNKEYPKEEYASLVLKIKEHMQEYLYADQSGRRYGYGEFFPTEFSPFAYNETLAQEYFPLTKKEALSRGLKWRDQERKTYSASISSKNVPDQIKDTSDSILSQVIACAHAEFGEGECIHNCTGAFKFIPAELEFYRRCNLPLPVLCYNCRYGARILKRNPLSLWKRECMCNSETSDTPQAPRKHLNGAEHFHGSNPCPNEFETSYPPDSPYIVYCEQCYNSEVV